MPRYRLQLVMLALTFTAAGKRIPAQGVDVTASFVAEQSASSAHKSMAAPQVVLWLTSVQPLRPDSPEPPHPGPFRLVQKNKQFVPHLLVVPTGSYVEFPNKDPFFHNVFSLFNGKRFDLGLYESGSTRSVRFDREGVSYVFCNIHPEMGAVVLALSTPYFAVSNGEGTVTVHDVPPGTYVLHIWSETYEPTDKTLAQQTLHLGATPLNLGQITLKRTADPMLQHKNKFGENYLPPTESPY